MATLTKTRPNVMRWDKNHINQRRVGCKRRYARCSLRGSKMISAAYDRGAAVLHFRLTRSRKESKTETCRAPAGGLHVVSPEAWNTRPERVDGKGSEDRTQPVIKW